MEYVDTVEACLSINTELHDTTMVRAFPMSTNANDQVLLALGSDQNKGQSMYSRRFICAKSHNTMKRSANVVQHAFFDVG